MYAFSQSSCPTSWMVSRISIPTSTPIVFQSKSMGLANCSRSPGHGPEVCHLLSWCGPGQVSNIVKYQNPHVQAVASNMSFFPCSYCQSGIPLPQDYSASNCKLLQEAHALGTDGTVNVLCLCFGHVDGTIDTSATSQCNSETSRLNQQRPTFCTDKRCRSITETGWNW